MKRQSKKLCEQATTFDSLRKFFLWVVSKQKDSEKREKYLLQAKTSEGMSVVCLELATII